MHFNSPPHPPLSLESGEQLDVVEDFTYLGSNISKVSGAQKDIRARFGKARGTFSKLNPIWKSKEYSLKTNVKLYKSNVTSVLLHRSECWRVVMRDVEVESFHNSCLRRICRVFWPKKISNKDLYTTTGCCSVVMEIKKRRLSWLGHVLRMPLQRLPRTSLRWMPIGRGKKRKTKHRLEEND